MFEDVGGKIKGAAKWLYYLNVISYIITAVILLVDEIWPLWLCLLAAAAGCTLSLVMSWLIYGFGELIERTQQNEHHNRQLVQLLKDTNPNPANTASVAVPKPIPHQAPQSGQHIWRCPHCGKGRTQSPCEYCGGE